MPATTKHRQRDAQDLPHYNARVARTVKPAEVKTNIKAQEAMEMEWRRLRQVPRKDGKVGVWDEDAVQEWSSMRRDAQRQNTKANVGLTYRRKEKPRATRARPEQEVQRACSVPGQQCLGRGG